MKTLPDAGFPGGNIAVESVEGNAIRVKPDLRDTEGVWFYWCFRMQAAADSVYRFVFDRRVIGVRGPGVSLDGGMTWRWLGADAVDGNTFAYTFPGENRDVRFSFGMPYQQSDLERFMAGLRNDERVAAETLCSSRKGRAVERVRFGRLDGGAAFRALLTCRHHACEMMANYALEGIMIETLSDSEDGRWLQRHVEFAAVPFVDKDGVEDGDQGKNRRPHDHGQDYGLDTVYPEPAALRVWTEGWLDGRPAVALDLHCPGPRGNFHESVLFPCRVRSPENWARMAPFFAALEKGQSGVLAYRRSDGEDFFTWDGKPYRPPERLRGFSPWAETLPGMRFAAPLEIPYANANGREVNQETARAFGRDLARALCRSLSAD